MVEVEIDTSLSEEIDSVVACDMPDHGMSEMCDNGPAVWICRSTHKCDPKTKFLCDKAKTLLEIDTLEFYKGNCGCLIPWNEFFEVVGKI